ncbi:MAG: hypothetical protein RIS47_1852 [Bacteroidota bacterium]|jgi:hypothetical protein
MWVRLYLKGQLIEKKMKRTALIVFLGFMFALNLFAIDGKPNSENKVKISYNGMGLLKVAVSDDSENVGVFEIFDSENELVFTQSIKPKALTVFNIARLHNGAYKVRIALSEGVCYVENIYKDIRL